MEARARVEEARKVKEAQYWGRVSPTPQKMPAFWSVAVHGQPYNRPELMDGVTEHWQVDGVGSGGSPRSPKGGVYNSGHGPAASMVAALRMSLDSGLQMIGKDFKPLRSYDKGGLARLGDEDRETMLGKLPVRARLQALCNCADQDVQAPGFQPWTQAILAPLDAAAWHAGRDRCIQLALARLEQLMRLHLRFLADEECRRACAPAVQPKHILRRAFMQVDPLQNGSVSIQQFMQVWQNVLQLCVYSDEEVVDMNGRTRKIHKPERRLFIDRNATAALFCHYGFDKQGLLPYVIFIRALCETPARLLGHEFILENGKHGVTNEMDISMCVGNAKIIYPKCKSGVFPPSGFDPQAARRSFFAPRAQLYLEHVFGYAGKDTHANNLFYTHNCTETLTEVVYYTGSLGIVCNKQEWEAGRPCQRFFFGHDNDIQCLTIHPNRRFVATGQQLSPGCKPYACIWDVDTCDQLQKLDHDHECRAVIGACFSGNINGTTEAEQGGSILLTITADDRHTVHVWRWMTSADKYVKKQYIPGWNYGPDKKVHDLTARGFFFHKPEADRDDPAVHKELNGSHPLIRTIRDFDIKPDDARGLHLQHRPMTEDGTWELLAQLAGFNGTPPMVYGASWNPFRASDGRPGSEFLTYGVKHMKTWSVNDDGQWIGQAASFGPERVQNVLCAIYVPAMHDMKGPADSCILSGFASGSIGLWVPPYPTRKGATYLLTRMFAAHAPGPLMTLNDGSQVTGGLRTLVLRSDYKHVLSGGADGFVIQWELQPPEGTKTDGTVKRGVRLVRMAPDEEKFGPNKFVLCDQESYTPDTQLPMICGLDCHPAKQVEFVAGTDGCDVWEVDSSPRIVVEGHEDDVTECATHPERPELFATACHNSQVRIFDTRIRDVVRSASMGFPAAALAFSQEEYTAADLEGWQPKGGKGFHLAVSGKTGRLAILDADTLQPLVQRFDSKEAIDEVRYSPAGGPKILAAASHDLKIYLYKADRAYQLIAKCVGHSGSVEHLDWTLPVPSPAKYRGRMLLQSTDNAYEILHWDPLTGQKVTSCMREAQMASYTSPLGFPVMGIWPDYADGTDINAVDRAKRGAPSYDTSSGGEAGPGPGSSINGVVDLNATASLALSATGSWDRSARIRHAGAQDSADGVAGCGYLVTADDYASVKLFNYPVVADDAPYRVYRGHASHVACVRFACDDRSLVSVGGFDRGIYLWRTCGIAAEDAERDAAVLAAVEVALEDRTQGDNTLIPKPLAKWGALDGTGRNFGPKTDVKTSNG